MKEDSLFFREKKDKQSSFFIVRIPDVPYKINERAGF